MLWAMFSHMVPRAPSLEVSLQILSLAQSCAICLYIYSIYDLTFMYGCMYIRLLSFAVTMKLF